MSQAGKLRDGTVLADVETLTGDTGGAVGPDGAFNINILGGTGIDVDGTPGTNTLTVSQDDKVIGTGQTVGAVNDDVYTFAAGGTAGTYTFFALISGFESTTPAGVGYSITGTVRTTGAATTLIGTPDKVVNEEAALVLCDANLVVNANNAIFRVTGAAGVTINWQCTIEWLKVE